ncbi:unnamed protein product [Rhizophagus irregularis]|uniref:Uncharacterized protein n=1 Tax=Rhizophagus irregularis TaxID=588596 RepID=A0A2I1HBR1_9GLOM|nr:hypothetical protein RhiirA4_476547 [Rhizophagus irregularis]CAB4432814.1 unnamed protein product [Rhizophagus irregularis]
MEIDYGKQVFDNYFVQVVTILTIFLVSGKGRFYEFFDDTYIFLSILLPTILRFFLTGHLFWGLFITILGLILVYLLHEFHYTPSPKSNYETKKSKESQRQPYKFFSAILEWFVNNSSLFPFYMTIYLFYLPLSVEVHDNPSKKIVSPFESPEYINSFCLTKSNVIGCKVSYYIRLYIVWFSILFCLIDFGLVGVFARWKKYYPLKYLSPLRFIWFVVLSLTPGVVFGILLSDENYYLYKISTGLPISACVSIVRHYVGKDVHTFFSHYINLHRMFKMSIDNLANAKVYKSYVDKKIKGSKFISKDASKKILEEIEKTRNDIMKDEKVKRYWVRNNINKTSTYILKITNTLKKVIIEDHVELDEKIKQDVNPQFEKAITKRLEKNVGSNLKDEIYSNLSLIIHLNNEKIDSNDENDIKSTLKNVRKKVTNLFLKFEDGMEGCGLFQILSEEDKDDIERNSSNISNIKTYLKNHDELLESPNNSSMEELNEIKCNC